MIGKLYVDGSGVQKNIKKAFEWFKKSAQQGSGDAIYALSTFYFDGSGVERDYIKSMALALIAKRNGVSSPQWADDIIVKSSAHLSIDEQNRAQLLTLNDII
jgi:TPR repeat protein